MSAQVLGHLKLERLEDTARLGAAIAAVLQPGDCIALVGTLGAGKTTLTQAILQALGVATKDVTSPTFAIIQSYATTLAPCHHIDAYRIDDDDAFFELGIEELWEDRACVTLIEWANKWERWLPERHLTIEIDWLDENSRQVTLQGELVEWGERASAIMKAFNLAK
jgi:tRNA threonylcarbamoyladenosine biosynthesis protein TsaE